MRILLIDSYDLKEPLAELVRDFLEPFSGPWKFELGGTLDEDVKVYADGGFNPMRIREFANLIPYNESSLKIQRWSRIFHRIKFYRRDWSNPYSHNLKDFMLLYTSERNEFNWFGMFDPSSLEPNGFVQGTYWEEYVQSESIFPILYQTIAIPLQWRMFKDAKKLKEATHTKPIGCINDFCEDKSDIILKLQTGNICHDCYDLALANGISEAEMDQIDSILDAIRLKFREFSQRRKKRNPYPVTIVNKGLKIYIGDSELRLRPLDKALYIFFLNAKQVYRTSDLADYERTILEYYKHLYNGAEKDEMIRNAGRLARNEDGLTNQAVSRINKEIERLVIRELADKYKIVTDPGGYKWVEIGMETDQS